MAVDTIIATIDDYSGDFIHLKDRYKDCFKSIVLSVHSYSQKRATCHSLPKFSLEAGLGDVTETQAAAPGTHSFLFLAQTS